MQLEFIVLGRKEAPLSEDLFQSIQLQLNAMEGSFQTITLKTSSIPWLAIWSVDLDSKASESFLRSLRRQLEEQIHSLAPVDVYLGPKRQFKDFKLLATDMDSTLINIECVDEIAAITNKKEQVAKITEDTMNGKIKNFEHSIRERVALLKGCPVSQLKFIYDQVLKLNPGAEPLIEEAKKHELKTLLVSGGFSFFVDRIVERLGFNFGVANQLDIQKNQLTGRLIGDIVDGKLKAFAFKNITARLNAKFHQTIAMGDGSNDLDMLNLAGLSVGYHAKPIVRKQVHFNIYFGGLHSVLALFEDTRATYLLYEQTLS